MIGLCVCVRVCVFPAEVKSAGILHFNKASLKYTFMAVKCKSVKMHSGVNMCYVSEIIDWRGSGEVHCND